ncbi:helix-turn-helix transcriptional regulator [Blautia sp. RD014234]|nr:helix-turn-helix transcriptional regulator [Blautia parvula]
MDIKTAVIYRLNDLINQKDITVNEAAVCSGVPPSTLKNILYGQSKNAGVVTIKKICDGLDGNKSVLKLREYNRAAILVFCSGYFEPTSDSINIGQPFRYIMKDLHDRSLKGKSLQFYQK